MRRLTSDVSDGGKARAGTLPVRTDGFAIEAGAGVTVDLEGGAMV